MRKNLSFIKNKRAMGNGTMILAIVLAVVVVVACIVVANRGSITFSVGNTGATPTARPIIPGGGIGDLGQVDVERKLAITLGDKFSSSLLPMTVKFYPSDSQQVFDTVTTDGDGYALTNQRFKSGDTYNIYLENSTAKMWINDFVIPSMSASDANGGASDPNPVSIQGFQIGTYTTDTLKAGATAIADAGSYNFTLSGSTPTLKYTLDNTGDDNTGLVDSQSPLTNAPQNWGTWVIVKLSGTGYGEIEFTGTGVTTWDSSDARYAAIRMDSNALTKWTDGSGTSYKTGFDGSDIATFGLNANSYSGSGVTMQITAYAYADAQYAAEHSSSNLGSAKVQIAEQTVTLIAV